MQEGPGGAVAADKPPYAESCEQWAASGFNLFEGVQISILSWGAPGAELSRLSLSWE